MKKFILLIFLLLTLAACAPWTRMGGPHSEDSYTVVLPDGWMKLNAAPYLMITRDGVLLQRISVEKRPVEQELRYTKKRLKKEMLPQEAAQVVIDDVSSNPNNLNFELIENRPVSVSGIDAFRVDLACKSKDGLRIRMVQYGFISGDQFFAISYVAARRYYFDKDLSTFEKVVQEFRLTKS
ncbi:MAG: hypothetical protein L7F78_04330 [Syntrophales bacterium LBB04]|nr:hypothetical protein [Syntrophales bacterium LBB04]